MVMISNRYHIYIDIDLKSIFNVVSGPTYWGNAFCGQANLGSSSLLFWLQGPAGVLKTYISHCWPAYPTIIGSLTNNTTAIFNPKVLENP